MTQHCVLVNDNRENRKKERENKDVFKTRIRNAKVKKNKKRMSIIVYIIIDRKEDKENKLTA
jgi:hypothetical protein